jgi:GH43 family beta-xylosidase
MNNAKIIMGCIGCIALAVLLTLTRCKTLDDEINGADETRFVSFNDRFYNPIKVDYMLGDPWMIRQGGKYYFLHDPISVFSTPVISGLMGYSKNGTKTIFRGATKNLTEVWASELHYYQDRWYVFFAADTNNDNTLHRMYVVRSQTSDVMGEWDYIGKLALPDDQWAIDGTFFEHGERIFHLWSGWKDISEGPGVWRQHLYITELKPDDPTQVLSNNRVMISTPTYEWETRGLPQNEGPTIVKSPAGTIYCIYSASYSGSNYYALGVLKLIGDDPMIAANWQKYPEPLLASDPANDIYSPGHCSVTKSPDGTEDWVIYHAAKAAGSGWDRNARAQKLDWVNDEPYMGKPKPLSEPQPLPSGEIVDRILIQAEDMEKGNDGMKTVNITGGKAINLADSKDSVAAVVHVEKAGRYIVNVRHTNYYNEQKTMQLKVNDLGRYIIVASRSGTIGSCTMASVIVPLESGHNMLVFSSSDNLDIDLIILDKTPVD